MKESMLTMASKNSSANGSDRASAWIGNTPSSTPASRIRWRFSEALNHRSAAQTCTPNSRRRKMDDDARPQPRSSTRMPGRKSIAVVSHSVTQSEFDPPLTLAKTHSGWYCEERGNRSETSRWSKFTWISLLKRAPCASMSDKEDVTQTIARPSLGPRPDQDQSLTQGLAKHRGCHQEWR